MKNEEKLREMVKEKIKSVPTADGEQELKLKLEEIQMKKLEKEELQKTSKEAQKELEALEKLESKKTNSQKIKELKAILEKNKKKLEQVSTELEALETGALKIAAMLLNDVKTAGELIAAAAKKEEIKTPNQNSQQDTSPAVNSVEPGAKLETEVEKLEKKDVVEDGFDLINEAQKYAETEGISANDTTDFIQNQAQKIKDKDTGLGLK
jgi:crotonobetainyl-CoA:carnitine CoA-transferase CaiB-like acyl-CoA transferase